MQKIEFCVSTSIDLTKAILKELPFLSKFDIKKMLENKDIKVNNQRVKDNILLNKNDLVVAFYQEKAKTEWYKVVYVDKNILIVNKRSGIEVVSGTERDLIGIIEKDYLEARAVHRIDRNTEGLVIFALNDKSEKSLLSAFKTRKGIVKKYALLCEGRVDISKIKRTVYLKKVDALKKVWISELKTSGYEQAITEFNLIEYMGNNSLLEATLITGKTHQIRAHIAYFGHPIIGDGKYGKSKEKQMCLTANFLSFNFDSNDCLNYLNSKSFEIVPSWL